MVTVFTSPQLVECDTPAANDWLRRGARGTILVAAK